MAFLTQGVNRPESLCDRWVIINFTTQVHDTTAPSDRCIGEVASVAIRRLHQYCTDGCAAGSSAQLLVSFV